MITSYSTSGGSADVASPNNQEDHPIDNLQEVEEAINYAQEAMDVAQKLEQANLQTHTGDTLEDRLLNVAVENYIEKFNIPRAALEDNLPAEIPVGGKKDAGRLKKIILYLYALVQRIFTAIFDFFSNQKLVARKIIPRTKEYIGRSDSLSASVGQQLMIKDKSLMTALHINGIAPAKTSELYAQLSDTFEKQYTYSAVNEVIALISAAKEKNPERVKKEAELLRAKLLSGFKASLKTADASDMSVFSEKKAEANEYYISEAMFGQNYITGVIGTLVNDTGGFNYRCGVRRDPEVSLRVVSFPVLTPEEIRHICRTSLRISENIIRFSRDEVLLQKALRESTFLVSKEPDESAVAALRDTAAVGQSSYIVYLRFVTRTMQAMMRWCNVSLGLYEGVAKNHG